MKTFDDLEFDVHPARFSMFGKFSEQARMDFDNGYGVSVITGSGAYSDNEHPYEVAVMKDGSLCYDTDITDDVIGYCDTQKVTDIMKQVQELKGDN